MKPKLKPYSTAISHGHAPLRCLGRRELCSRRAQTMSSQDVSRNQKRTWSGRVITSCRRRGRFDVRGSSSELLGGRSRRLRSRSTSGVGDSSLSRLLLCDRLFFFFFSCTFTITLFGAVRSMRSLRSRRSSRGQCFPPAEGSSRVRDCSTIARASRRIFVCIALSLASSQVQSPALHAAIASIPGSTCDVAPTQTGSHPPHSNRCRTSVPGPSCRGLAAASPQRVRPLHAQRPPVEASLPEPHAPRAARALGKWRARTLARP